MESAKAPVSFIFFLNNPAICQTRNVKLVKPETFFFFTIITASNVIMQRRPCNGMADHKSFVCQQRLRFANSIHRGWSAAGTLCLLHRL